MLTLLYQLESQPGTVQPFRQPSNPVLRPVMGGRYCSCLRNSTPPIPRPENRRKDIRTAVLLLLLRHPDRSETGALSVLPAGLLPESLLGNNTSREVPAGRRLEVYRLRRACQSRRYAGTDYRPLDVFLLQNQDALYGCAGHDSRSHTCHRLLHPPCQPDELRDYRQAGRCARAFVFERVDAAPPSGTALRGNRLLHLLPGHGLPVQARTKAAGKQAQNGLQHHQSQVHRSANRRYRHHRGFFFGLCLTEIFVFRFFIEFLKEDQVDFESAMTLNMGQWLSIPFILIGVYFMCFHGKKTAGK